MPPRLPVAPRLRWPFSFALAAFTATTLAVLVALATGGEANAAAPAEATILLNQKQMEIGQLIARVSQETGRTILYDEQVRGTVSIVSKRAVTRDEAWELLASALHMLGFSLLPSTVDQWKISRVADAVGESPFVGEAKRATDRYVTALIPLEVAHLPSVMNVLTPLAGTTVTLIALSESNSIIASGPEQAIARLTSLADELDRVEERALRQRVLRYRGVEDVEAMIQMQFEGGGFTDRDLEVWSDERTNSVIFRGAEETVERLLAFLDDVDRPIEGQGEIRILRILNRDAGDIGQILGAQAPAAPRSKSKKSEKDGKSGSDANGGTGSNGTGTGGTGSSTQSGQSSQGQSQNSSSSSSRGNGPNAAPGDSFVPEDVSGVGGNGGGNGAGNGGGMAGGNAGGAGGNGSDAGGNGGGSIDLKKLLEDEDYSIAVDEPTRSLVVRASERGHRLIRQLVEELDAPPQLVAVDITVSELRTPSSWALALSYHVPLLPGDALDEYVGRLISLPAGRGFGTRPIDDGALFGRVSRDAGVDFDIPGQGGVQIPIEDTGVIDASTRKIRNEVLIQPSLVVVAGEEHEIFVGNNIPIPVSANSGTGGTGGTTGGTIGTNGNAFLTNSITFNRQDVGVRLTLDVRAGKEGPIRLGLETEISSIAPSLAGDPTKVGPTLLKELLTAKATLEDGETAILGVDRERTEATSQGGTPWLSDIPFLGWLFKARGQTTTDVRLVIAARARRVSTPAELAADTIRRRLAFQRQSAREDHLPHVEGSPYGVLVTTRTVEGDADAIASALEDKGHATRIHRWQGDDRRTLFDVYVTGLESMSDAGDLAYQLGDEGWDADLVVFPHKS